MSVPSTLSNLTLIVSVDVFESHPKLLIAVHLPSRHSRIFSAFYITMPLKEH